MTDMNLEVPPHVAETVHAIALLHAEHHRKSTFAERIVDRATATVGRPTFLLTVIGLVFVWAAGNSIAQYYGGWTVDPGPFGYLDTALTLAAFAIALMILTSQRRADRFANLREQMTLEATLLTEQKTRKIIELLEELRRDSPNVRDRVDVEAAQMSEKANPHTVMAVIEEVTQEVVTTVGESSEDKRGLDTSAEI